MIKGETSTGFSFEIDPEVLDDMELIDLLSEIDDGNTLALPKVIKRVLGEKSRKALYDHVRVESGRVPSTALMNELAEIFNSVGAKN